MRISCILTSFNRPTFVRQALKSVAAQTRRDFELFVMDDSSLIDIRPIVSEFSFPRVEIHHEDVSPEERASVNRLSVNVNKALRLVQGDLLSFLADDDYYFPTWFERASEHFERNPGHFAAFGILKYSRSREMELGEHGEFRFSNAVVAAPFGQLDHNQVVHRRFDPPYLWNEGIGTAMNADAWYWNEIARSHLFHPVNAWAAVKRLHEKNLQNHVSELQGAKLNDLRE